MRVSAAQQAVLRQVTSNADVPAPRDGAPVEDSTGAASATAAAGDTWTDPQGRVWNVSRDAETGGTLLTHASTFKDPKTGEPVQLTMEILLRPDNSARRTVTQTRALADGTKSDVITSELRGNAEVKHVEQQVVRRTGKGAEGDDVAVSQVITATWGDGTAPVDLAKEPLETTFSERTTLTDPDGGIDKNHPRVLTIGRDARIANGTIQWQPASYVVRWEGPDDDYLERRFELALGADGNPAPGASLKLVGQEDGRDWYEKVMEKGRIWGGLGTSLVGWMGLNFARSSSGRMGTIGKVMLGAGLSTGALQIAGEGYALLKKQNDANGARFGMALYDTTALGLAAAVTLRAPKSNGASLAQLPVMASGVVHLTDRLGMNGADSLLGLAPDHLRSASVLASLDAAHSWAVDNGLNKLPEPDSPALRDALAGIEALPVPQFA